MYACNIWYIQWGSINYLYYTLVDWGFYLYFLLHNWFSNQGIVHPTSACHPHQHNADIIEVSEKGKKKKKNVLSVSWGGASLFCWCLWYTSLPVFGDFVSQLLEGESSHISEDWGGMSDQPSHKRRQRQLWMHKWITETVHCKHFCELETSLCITLSSLF